VIKLKLKENKELGLKLKEIRKNINCTQNELAESLNIHVNTIKRYEKGLSIPKEFLKKFSSEMDLDFNEQQELYLLYESNGDLKSFYEKENQKVYHIDKLLELIGYEIISKYKVFLENDYNNNDSYDYLKVKDLKTGIVYDEDSNENLAYILEIYNDIEWYLKVLVERYLKNK
jgi:DNA-binding helix-turn-helix protein